ncbi:MAG: cupredoxin domain-containing protein [Bacteroidetes bacterium]|nr:cupredoxin domain-containing protein [Bacteroidota bacterium]
MKRFTTLFVISCSLLCITCSKKPKGSPGENEIWLEYKLFQPSQLIVKSGTTVTFTNKDNANHSATNINGLFDSGKISSGQSYSFTFTKTGSFSFYCKYHSSVTAEQGYITVQ